MKNKIIMCKCGCNTCETKITGPLLTESKVKSLLSENLQFHIDENIPLSESQLSLKSKSLLIKEARKLYSRNVLDLSEGDLKLMKEKTATKDEVYDLIANKNFKKDFKDLDDKDKEFVVDDAKKRNLTEEPLHENEMSQLGDELASAIEDELEDKKDELNEALDPISILSYILAGTTLTNLLAKWVGKLFKKYNFGKGEAAAKKIYDFTHKLEGDFKKPIERVVGLFSKDPKTKRLVTDSLFALLILALGVHAGGGALKSLSKGNIASGTISGLKAALKGKDLTTLVKDIAGAVT
jgi:hypothetical protein